MPQQVQLHFQELRRDKAAQHIELRLKGINNYPDKESRLDYQH
jgi:hypothetical protein